MGEGVLMKFAHIADLHIGKRVHDFSMLEDQRYILDQMLGIFEEQRVDGILPVRCIVINRRI